MSGNGYGGYYYAGGVPPFPPPPPPPPSQPNSSRQSWSEWTLEQQQYNKGNYGHGNHNQVSPQQQSSVLSNLYGSSSNHRSPNFYPNDTSDRHYQQQQRRFTNLGPSIYSTPPPPLPLNQGGWQHRNYNNQNNKRPRPLDSPNIEDHNRNKGGKKKKKPLSQNIPSKKDWTLEEAEQALSVEKDYNKRFKNHSLIIKFPDLELNRDIVSKFHSSIENVHFQQPSTPRFCFVTLQENADADTVIEALNKIRFGDGYLSAEFKRDREDDQNVGPEDIDPCTLYVGNLAQEITKEDMVKTYPRNRRIDIGYAKKMKYTRYAFVAFKNVADSVEAFKKTHSTQMYSKSLIVRFRRLHGTVGMPGESKPQSPAKRPDSAPVPTNEAAATYAHPPPEPPVENSDVPVATSNNVEVETVENNVAGVEPSIDLSVVKKEVEWSDDEVEGDKKSTLDNYESPFMPGSIEKAIEQHRPVIEEIKKEPVEEVNSTSSLGQLPLQQDISSSSSSFAKAQFSIKSEPQEPVVIPMVSLKKEQDDESSDDDIDDPPVNVNFTELLNQIVDHSKKIQSLKKAVP